MITDLLRSLLHAAPFEPFAIRMADGQAIPVKHPDMMIISPGGSTAVTYVGDEALKIIHLVQVTTLETIDGKPIEADRP